MELHFIENEIKKKNIANEFDDSNNLKTNIVIKSIIEQWVSLQEEKAQRITHLRNGFFGISASAKRQREAEDNNQNPSQKLKIDF